jgi:DDE superfamily endonuclease
LKGLLKDLSPQEEPVRSNRTIGLSEVQFDELVERVGRLITWDKGVGRPRGLTLAQAVKATLTYFKNNITEEVIAELLFVSQALISQTISRMEGLVVRALREFEPTVDDVAQAAEHRVVVVDGSLHPCWSWADRKDLWSGKHKTTGHLHQYVCDLDGELTFISDPLPGRTHDARAFRDLGLDDHLTPGNALADKGYVGCAVTTPFKKPAGGELLDWHRDVNTVINRHRYVIERAIANFKTWRAMHTDYRRPVSTYKTAFTAIRALHFFKLRF